jgi:hypothetical protein
MSPARGAISRTHQDRFWARLAMCPPSCTLVKCVSNWTHSPLITGDRSQRKAKRFAFSMTHKKFAFPNEDLAAVFGFPFDKNGT